jgi:hypothetical protein
VTGQPVIVTYQRTVTDHGAVISTETDVSFDSADGYYVDERGVLHVTEGTTGVAGALATFPHGGWLMVRKGDGKPVPAETVRALSRHIETALGSPRKDGWHHLDLRLSIDSNARVLLAEPDYPADLVVDERKRLDVLAHADRVDAVLVEAGRSGGAATADLIEAAAALVREARKALS